MVLAIQRKLARKLRIRRYPIIKEFLGEFCGTTILLVFGIGVNAQTFFLNKDQGVNNGGIGIATGWGIGVAMGVFFAGRAGRGHVNPAMSLAMAVIGKLKWNRVWVYMLAHHLGAFVGSLIVYGCYYERLTTCDVANCTYLLHATGNIFRFSPRVSRLTCFMDMVLSSALLSSGVNAITDKRGFNPPSWMVPICVGALVTCLVGCFAVNAGVPLNPARDLSPRILLTLCGWGVTPFTANNYYFIIPYTSNYVGAVAGAVLYELLIGIHMPAEPEPEANNPSQLESLCSCHCVRKREADPSQSETTACKNGGAMPSIKNLDGDSSR